MKVPNDGPSRKAWRECRGIAERMADGKFKPTTEATHYHYVGTTPYWAAGMKHLKTIGRHKFYREGNGGSPAESVESLRKWILTTTNGSMELARGASNVALQMLLRTKNADAWSQATNFHSTVKPQALMRHLVRLVTQPGGVVLDPFMGSGSTGVAAMKEGMRFIGIEMNPAYFEIAYRRIEHAQQQATLGI